MIILGLQWSINDAELRRYFEQFGEVAAAEVYTCTCMHVHAMHNSVDYPSIIYAEHLKAFAFSNIHHAMH